MDVHHKNFQPKFSVERTETEFPFLIKKSERKQICSNYCLYTFYLINILNFYIETAVLHL